MTGAYLESKSRLDRPTETVRGQTQDAEDELVRGFEALRLSLGAEHRRTQEALRRLVGYLRTIGERARVSRYEALLEGS